MRNFRLRDILPTIIRQAKEGENMSKRLISLFLLSLVSAILMISVLVAGYYTLVYRSLVRQNDLDAQIALDDVINRIDKELADNMESGDVIANYGDMIADFMKGDEIKRLETRNNVRFLLSMQLELQMGLKYICVYPQDGSRMYVGSSAMQEKERTAANEICNSILIDYDLRYSQLRTQITHCYNWRGQVFYAIIVPVFQTTGNRYLGSLVFLYNGENIQNMLPGKSKVKLIVVSGHESIAKSGNEIYTLWKDGHTQSMMQNNLSSVDWMVYASTSEQALEDTVSSLWKLCIVVFVSTGFAFGLLVILQYHKIVGPIIAIAHQTAEIGDDPSKEISISFGVNEFDILIQSINAMLIGQRKMSAEILHIKTSAYEEQISFLQSQINPHFLYNCLESIRGMASREMLGAVREMVSRIAMIYRYCSKGGPYATVWEEAACAKNYTKVMNLCYRSTYQVIYQINEDTEEMPVPRMILQPLIENAILHGFSGQRREAGNIWITAMRKDECLTLSVEDDGCGIPREQLDDWNSRWKKWSETGSGKIGLTNVIRRVWLLYGEQAKVRFSAGHTCRGLKIEFCLNTQNLRSCTIRPNNGQTP